MFSMKDGQEIIEIDSDDEKASQAEFPFDKTPGGALLSRKCFQWALLTFCENKFFTFVINISIIMNTLCLGLDSYPTDIQLQAKLDLVNIAFFSLFFFEMLVKIGGMGPRKYLKDSYNVFDAMIGNTHPPYNFYSYA
jgi:Ion transport protein